MGRAKIAMEPMSDVKKRKLTFDVRKQGLFKKARELATLCDVDVSMIIISDDQEETPEIFPTDREKLVSSIDYYKSSNRSKNSYYSLLNYLMDRKNKIEEDLDKARKMTLEAKYPTSYDLDKISESDLNGFAFWLGNKIVDVEKRIKSMQNFVSVDYNNCVVDPLIMQSISSSDSVYPNMGNMGPGMMMSSYLDSYQDPLMDLLLSEDDDTVVYGGENFGSQFLLLEEHGFQPDLVDQFLVSDNSDLEEKDDSADSQVKDDYDNSQVKKVRREGPEIVNCFSSLISKRI